jgi:hypothetical protein
MLLGTCGENVAYVLADKETASDADFERVEAVVRWQLRGPKPGDFPADT